MQNLLRYAILAWFTLPIMVSSQTQRVDSLKQVFIGNSISQAEKGLLAFKIAEQYRNTRFLDSALHYADLGLELSKAGKEDRRMMYYNITGQIHFLSGSYLLANRFFDVGMEMALEVDDKKYQAFFANSAGISYATSGRYEEALASFYTSLKLSQESGKHKRILSTQLNLANLHGKLDQRDKAIPLLEEVYDEAISFEYHRFAVRALIALAEHFEELRRYPKALAMLRTARDISIERKFLERISCAESMGRIHSKLGEEILANELLTEALESALEIGQEPLIISLYTTLGDAKFEARKFDIAASNFEEALQRTDSSQMAARMSIHEKLAFTYEKLNHLVPAFQHGMRAKELNEKIYAKESAQRMAELDANFAFEEKMRRIEELEAAEKYNKAQFWGVTAVLLITLLALVFAIRLYKVKQSINTHLASHNEKIRLQNTLLAEQSIVMKEQNKDLVQTNQDLEYFAYAASHDLKEPLRTIISYIGLVKLRFKEANETSELMDFAMNGAIRMEALLNDLLVYARIGRSPKLELIETHELLDGVCAGLEMVIKETDAKITYDELPAVMGKRSEMHLLFQNILSNAIKFRRKDIAPEIQITGKRTKLEVEIRISDNGIGINPRYKEKVFAAFQRLHTRDIYEGTGIGLAIVKKIVEMNQGEVTFESDPDNEPGTTFIVKFPN